MLEALDTTNTKSDGMLGHIERGFIRNNKILISGWCLDKNYTPAKQVLVKHNKNTLITLTPNIVRSDVAEKLNIESTQCGFEIEIETNFFSDEQIYQLEFFGADSKGNSCPLQKGESFFLDRFNISTEKDFYKNVQVTHSRIKHDESLIYLSQKAIDQYPDTPLIQASALCVLGYRLIKLFPQNNLDNKQVEYLKQIQSKSNQIADYYTNVKTNTGYRWSISLIILSGFINMFLQDYKKALEYFDEVCVRKDIVKAYPICCYNVTTGFFIAGYLSCMLGDPKKANKYWQDGCQNIGPFTSYHKSFHFGDLAELTFAVRTALQCAVAREFCLKDTDFHQSFLQKIDFDTIKQPFERIITGNSTAKLPWHHDWDC